MSDPDVAKVATFIEMAEKHGDVLPLHVNCIITHVFFFFEIAILFSDIHVHVYALKEIESFRENQIFLNNITCATVV